MTAWTRLWLVAVLCMHSAGTMAQERVHGSGDAFVAPGIALAWAVARGADEASTMVVLRVVTDPARYAAFGVAGVDPFTKGETARHPAATSRGTLDVRIPRSAFGDHPGTEIRLYATATAAQAGAPRLVVYYAGIPDTTPEFIDTAKLDAYLDDRIARARAVTGGKSP